MNPSTTATDWPRSSTETLSHMKEVLGEFPATARKVPLNVQVLQSHRENGIKRDLITYDTEPGDSSRAWLLAPDSASTERTGILCLHQTIRVGKDEAAGLAGSPNLHYGLELARRGFVTLCPDYPYPGYGESTVDPYDLGYASAAMKGIWNHQIAVDLLIEWAGVRPDRIGSIGHSLGGYNTLLLAAFDPRIHTAVTSCGFTRFTWNNDEGKGRFGDISDWGVRHHMPRITERYGSRCENMPFDFPDVLAAICPRPLFINAPEEDFFRVEGVRETIELVRPLYARQGVADHLEVILPEGKHDFPDEARLKAYAFLDHHLGSSRD